MEALFNTALENQLLGILALLSFVLLVVITLGVIYLTAVEWRDRRRRQNEVGTLPSINPIGKTPAGKTGKKSKGK